MTLRRHPGEVSTVGLPLIQARLRQLSAVR